MPSKRTANSSKSRPKAAPIPEGQNPASKYNRRLPRQTFTKGTRYPVAPDSVVAYGRLRREIHDGWVYFWANRTKPETILK